MSSIRWYSSSLSEWLNASGEEYKLRIAGTVQNYPARSTWCPLRTPLSGAACSPMRGTISQLHGHVAGGVFQGL
jgi:hypothetical protein